MKRKVEEIMEEPHIAHQNPSVQFESNQISGLLIIGFIHTIFTQTLKPILSLFSGSMFPLIELMAKQELCKISHFEESKIGC